VRAQPICRARAAVFAAVLALAPTVALAHVKWFEDPSPYPLRADLILSGRTAVFLAASALAITGMYLLQRLLGSPHWPEIGFLRKMAIGAPTLLAVQAAIGLVHAAVGPALFAPNLMLPRDALGYALGAVQILIAFSFVTGIGDWIGAIALILLGPIAFLRFPLFDVLDQFYWAGIGVAILVIGRFAVEAAQARPWFRERSPAWSARAVAALRIIAGAAIVAPALSEKIWNPDLGAAFLANRPHFNIMRTFLGLEWFTDDLFVMAVGVTEGIIGVLLASGLLTRVVILGMFVPFNAGVPFLPPEELLGHIPIFGVMYFLLVHSSGIAPGESTERPAPPGSSSEPAGAGSA
jgi:hypothetical protein